MDLNPRARVHAKSKANAAVAAAAELPGGVGDGIPPAEHKHMALNAFGRDQNAPRKPKVKRQSLAEELREAMSNHSAPVERLKEIADAEEKKAVRPKLMAFGKDQNNPLDRRKKVHSFGGKGMNAQVDHHGVHHHHHGHIQGHRSYEHMHNGAHQPGHGELMAVFYFVFGFMVAAQVLLYFWRKKHPRSYQLVTLLGLWLIPPVLSYELSFWRFVVVWIIFSGVTGYLVYQSSRRPIVEKSTPRLVYGWFLVLHNLCVGMGTGGYVLVAMDVLGVGPVLLHPLGVPKDLGFMLLFYGLYFGVLARDCAEMCADRMVNSMGHTSRGWTPSINVCALCGGELLDYEHVGGEAPIEKTVQLNCKHLFHEFCIRGWTIVGKKDTCPYCHEKVNIKEVLGNPKWQRNSILWNQLCDGMRYLVVWNPVMLVGIQLSLYFLGFVAPHPPHDAVVMVEVVDVGDGGDLAAGIAMLEVAEAMEADGDLAAMLEAS